MAMIRFFCTVFRPVYFIFLLLWMPQSWAQIHQVAHVDGVRVWTSPEYTRLVLDLSSVHQHHLFTLSNPDRIVIDLQDTRLKTAIRQPRRDHRVLRGIRQGVRNSYDLRLVLDLKKGVRAKSFVLRPNARYGQRLVIDLYDRPAKALQKMPKMAKVSLPVEKKVKKQFAKRNKIKQTKVAKIPAREVVIAIDAGHGGEDPGAIGARGVREKDVVLAIARKLERLVKREYGMRPVMIRTGDYYVKLRDRMGKARREGADLFISIHADAFKDHKVKGASVYVLSSRGANSEASRFLLAQEEASDRLGGAVVEGKERMVRELLLDLSQAYTQSVSEGVADKVLGNLKRLGEVHKPTIQKAAFVVLKSPDVPSLLVETAFITNPKEARKLKNPKHQQKLAKSILQGIRAYFQQKPPPGTLLAARKGLMAKNKSLGSGS